VTNSPYNSSTHIDRGTIAVIPRDRLHYLDPEAGLLQYNTNDAETQKHYRETLDSLKKNLERMITHL